MRKDRIDPYKFAAMAEKIVQFIGNNKDPYNKEYKDSVVSITYSINMGWRVTSLRNNNPTTMWESENGIRNVYRHHGEASFIEEHISALSSGVDAGLTNMLIQNDLVKSGVEVEVAISNITKYIEDLDSLNRPKDDPEILAAKEVVNRAIKAWELELDAMYTFRYN